MGLRPASGLVEDDERADRRKPWRAGGSLCIRQRLMGGLLDIKKKKSESYYRLYALISHWILVWTNTIKHFGLNILALYHAWLKCELGLHSSSGFSGNFWRRMLQFSETEDNNVTANLIDISRRGASSVAFKIHLPHLSTTTSRDGDPTGVVVIWMLTWLAHQCLLARTTKSQVQCTHFSQNIQAGK